MWSVILTALVALTLTYEAFSKGRARQNWGIIKSYRPVHFITSIPIIGLVLTAAVLLITYVPFMDKNPILWFFSWLFGWGEGEGVGNILFSGFQWQLYAILIYPVIMFALPSLAKVEEELFRQGTRDWKNAVPRSLLFGLIHVFAFIPLGAVIALTIGGLWFTHQYFKGGVERSTVYHAAYNSIAVTMVFVATLAA